MRTLQEQVSTYAPAVKLGKVLPRSTQSALRLVFFIGAVCFSILGLFGEFLLPTIAVTIWWGGALLFASLWVDQVLAFAYHNSFYFRGLDSIISHEPSASTDTTYDVAEVVLTHPDDVARAFCESLIGGNVLVRSGIRPQTISEFIAAPRRFISADMVTLPENEIFSLIGLGKYLLAHDTAFRELFSRQGINEQFFIQSLRWIVGTHHSLKRSERWWSKDNLSKTSGIGQDWSYGTAYTLQRFSRDIRTSAVFSTLTLEPNFAKEKISEIEATLARGQGANVLLIGEAGVGKIDLIMEVEKRMKNGKSLQAITGQHIYVLDTNRLFAVHPNKQSLELALLHLFDEALAAGNTTIVIENISTFIKEAEQLGIYIPELLDEYLSTSYLHIIATDTPGNFHQFLEPLGGFIRRFSEVTIATPDNQATVRVLEGVALRTEFSKQVLFTYESLVAIATAAERYIVEGVMPDKAISLLGDVSSKAQTDEQVFITADYVYKVVSSKTNMPAGPISSNERDLLLHLEDTLHQQVIGQQQALTAIARTMRRARAGIQSSEKPIGSFLFLGPTGVGKTETAKALAKTFFGSESKLERIDMSEFSGADALPRLLGDGNESGLLPDLLREHPYCVLLLDEFEKATKQVHDLFLQILDEGIFTDARGTKVNARNTIIIATSNAGSDLILRTVEQRKELAHLTEEIISHIIKSGAYRPELINRFDSTIIFEPLTITEQGAVASLMLGGLTERIKEKGFTLQVGKDLMDILVEKGYSPEFGARPMLRVLQNVLEEKVAQKIISGELERGQTLTLTAADFTEDELAA